MSLNNTISDNVAKAGISYFKDFVNTTLSNILSKFLIAILIMLIGFIIGKLTEKILYKILSELQLNNILKKIKVNANFERILSSFATYFIFFISVIAALNQMGVTRAILNVLSIGIILVIIISAILGIKDFFPSFFAGLHIYKKNLLAIGDSIKYKQIEGEIIEMTLLETVIQTKSKDIIYIPNVNLIKNEVIILKSSKEEIEFE